jgi:hypothetical protein
MWDPVLVILKLPLSEPSHDWQKQEEEPRSLVRQLHRFRENPEAKVKARLAA